jgi:hypothetical protein
MLQLLKPLTAVFTVRAQFHASAKMPFCLFLSQVFSGMYFAGIGTEHLQEAKGGMRNKKGRIQTLKFVSDVQWQAQQDCVY